jgi:hypothetical protein
MHLGLVMSLATLTAAHGQTTEQPDLDLVGKPFYENSGHKALLVAT